MIILKYSFHCEEDDHNHDCDVHQFSLSYSMNEKAQRLSSNGLIYDAVLCGKNDNDDIWFGYNIRVLILYHHNRNFHHHVYQKPHHHHH